MDNGNHEETQGTKAICSEKAEELRGREAPGGLVQVDTTHVSLLPGRAFKHFSTRDMMSEWDVCDASSRAAAKAAARFLDTLQERMPFPTRAIQVDGGSEFNGEFEEECERRGIRLLVLPPQSPKLDGVVERANRTYKEEFYEVLPLSSSISAVRSAQREWERIYNTVRPHQALDYLAPLEFIQKLGICCERRQVSTTY